MIDEQLRDMLAAVAMHAELVTAGALLGPAQALAEAAEEAGRSIEAQIAFNAYEVADAMLRERSRIGSAEPEPEPDEPEPSWKPFSPGSTAIFLPPTQE